MRPNVSNYTSFQFIHFPPYHLSSGVLVLFCGIALELSLVFLTFFVRILSMVTAVYQLYQEVGGTPENIPPSQFR